MSSEKIKKKFLKFFKKKGHKIIPSSSLLPRDATVLFTTAGMQQFTLYLQGEKNSKKDFKTKHLTSCQKCFRTDDIEEVGDDTHHTFFEMLGNWSIGQDSKGKYFKKGAIKYALEFLVDCLEIKKEKLSITIFKGDKGVPKDDTAREIWQKNGILPEKISEFGVKDNFWGPVGKTGPCGPCSEIFYDRGEEFGCKDAKCGPNCPNCNRFVEIWNLVFMEYIKDEEGLYNPLSQKNIDTGIGFERIVSLLQEKKSAYETDLFLPIIKELERISNKTYKENKKIFRILADHIRAIVFLAAEGVFPSNVEQGYILRRLLRRSIRYGKLLGLENGFMVFLTKKVVEIYSDSYPEVKQKELEIIEIIKKEEDKFKKTLEKGLRQFEKISKKGKISDMDAFHLYDTYGFPLELTKELAEEKDITVDEEGFRKAFKKHQEISRAGAEKKFGGVGKNATREATKLHTATHLLHQSLREVLGLRVRQMGSDVTSVRLRFDFSYPEKLTVEQKQEIENMINQKIRDGMKVKKEEMLYRKAIESGALAFFKEKYPERVNVYSILDSSGNVFSKEVCAGPHVNNTEELGHFKILKEKSIAAGIRRIRAILE